MRIVKNIVGQRPKSGHQNQSVTDFFIGKYEGVIIFNLIGQVVYSNEFNSDKVRINVEQLPAGIYFIRLNDSEVRKFVRD
ncbi:MAG: T9SS type A sorting domain-containing protein [Legionellales bacterium]